MPWNHRLCTVNKDILTYLKHWIYSEGILGVYLHGNSLVCSSDQPHSRIHTVWRWQKGKLLLVPVILALAQSTHHLQTCYQTRTDVSYPIFPTVTSLPVWAIGEVVIDHLNHTHTPKSRSKQDPPLLWEIKLGRERQCNTRFSTGLGVSWEPPHYVL